jgi:hypothetical protein
MKPIAEEIDKVLRNVFAKHSKIFAEIMINWPKIIGAQFGSATTPVKIAHTTNKGVKINILHVRADSAAVSMELTYHQAIILERIAVYFGYKAIDKLYIKLC